MKKASLSSSLGRRDALICALLFVVTLAVYLWALPRSLLPGDAGELISASRTLSVAHPPGYPLYLMLGRVFSWVFALGSVAYRYNLMSAVLASVVAAMLYLNARLLGAGLWVAVAVVAGVATRPAWWLQATGAEVYTLNALFVAALMIAVLVGAKRGDRLLVLIGILGGLALSHHLSLVYALVAAVAGLLLIGVRPRLNAVALCVLMFLVGLTVWLYIPVRAAQTPPLTWGDTASFKGFVSHITAQGYKWRLKPFEPGPRLGDLVDYVRLMFRQAGLWLSALALLGAVVSYRRWRLLAVPVLVYALYGLHTAAYNIPDIDSHVFPALLAVGVLAALGADFLAARLARMHKAARIAVPAAVTLIFAADLISFEPRQDEWFAHDYAMAAIESADGAAEGRPLIIGSGSALDFPVLYFSLVESAPADVFLLGVSNAACAGLPGNTRYLDDCVESALENRPARDLALIGPVPSGVAGHTTQICGMVYVLDGSDRDCIPPARYQVRGRNGDSRDFNSRLLGGTYNLHQARYCLAQGQTDSARVYIGLAVEAAYDDAGTLIYASRLFLEAGSPAEAFRMAERAVEVDPDFFEAHSMLASICYLGGNIDRAISEYEKALKGNPNPAPAYSNLANAYSRKGDYATAIKYYREALRLDERTVNAHIGLGIGLARTGDPDLGLQHLRTAREMQPDSPNPYHSEANVLIGLDRYDEAIKVIGEGLSAVPGDAALLADMGLARLRTGEPDSAAHYLELALDADPNLLAARGNLAIAYERAGDLARAREQYRKYVQTAPPGPARDRAAAALEALEK
jgi:tetratricopeptide (TPR) repeat protein